MKTISLILAVVFAATLIGCTQEEQSAGTGALIGAGVGAIIGHQSGEAKEGALIGGVIGGLAGYQYGKMKQRQAPTGEIQNYVDCPKCQTTLNLSAEAGAAAACRQLQETSTVAQRKQTTNLAAIPIISIPLTSRWE